ncbi:hypothetical protein E2C01_056534 [Portunus trituberculatus]|uniref:Uncharacterized protein n=1 Tax=Portunus trituberculatus TaxID=210409 RepID=A0A5B7GXY1_PORTR|nr:hypothetical protein [Portunus trituberculatus]
MYLQALVHGARLPLVPHHPRLVSSAGWSKQHIKEASLGTHRGFISHNHPLLPFTFSSSPPPSPPFIFPHPDRHAEFNVW